MSSPEEDPPGSGDERGRLSDGGWFVVAPDPGSSSPGGSAGASSGGGDAGSQIQTDEPAPADRVRMLRDKAEEVRTAASHMVDPDSRRSLMHVADHYDRLAGRVSDRRRAAHVPDGQSSDGHSSGGHAHGGQSPDADD